MGLAGAFISSSAGGLSIVISIFAIRRRLRRQKTNHQDVSSELAPSSTKACSDATSDQDVVFIKNCSDDLASRRGAAVIRSQHKSSGISVASDEHATEESYIFHDSGICEEDSFPKMVAADDVLKHHVDKSVTEPRQDSQRSSPPLKEFTIQASDATYGSESWEASYESFEASTLSEAYSGAPDDSGSQTESCSFGDDGFLSEEETARMGVVEYEEIIDSPLEMSKSIELHATRGKRVSFQLEDYAGRHCEFSNNALDGEKTVAADIHTSTDMEGTAGVVSVPENGDNAVQTWDKADDSASTIDDLDSQNESPLSMVHKAVTETQGVSDSVAHREVNQPRMHFENQNVRTEKKLSLVSIHPLAHVAALDDVVTALPSSVTPVIMREHNYGTSMASDVISAEDKRQWGCDEFENSKALLSSNKTPQNSHRSRDKDKENDASSPVSSTERLPRQPRRGTERHGMFRRNSHPALKRFRFSDRIKARPLRSSYRNSN